MARTKLEQYMDLTIRIQRILAYHYENDANPEVSLSMITDAISESTLLDSENDDE